jgi:hypothetical protein
MSTIKAYLQKDAFNIKQTRVKREWMDNTWDSHAYKCFPLNITNSIGYELSSPEDIVFAWDGIDDTSPDHINFISGEKYCSTSRGNATLTFVTGIMFETDPKVSMFHMPVPNYFREEFQVFSTIISTSWYRQMFPSVIKLMKPNIEIVIKAGEPIATLIPISLTSFEKDVLELYDYKTTEEEIKYNEKKLSVYMKNFRNGEVSNWYRDETDHTGKKLGSHELKSLKLKIEDKRSGGGN